MSNYREFEESSVEAMFDSIAATIRKLSPTEMTEDESRKAARVVIGYVQVIYNYQVRRSREELEKLRKLKKPLPTGISLELPTRQHDKNTA